MQYLLQYPASFLLGYLSFSGSLLKKRTDKVSSNWQLAYNTALADGVYEENFLDCGIRLGIGWDFDEIVY